jgi:hypothetical protein
VTPPSVLTACDDAEKASVLAALIDGDPSLRQRAEEMARLDLATVDIPAVIETATDALLRLDTDDLANRAGRRRHGYVRGWAPELPAEATWQVRRGLDTIASAADGVPAGAVAWRHGAQRTATRSSPAAP